MFNPSANTENTLFRRKKKPTIELPGAYKVRLTRRYDAHHSQAISAIPTDLFADIDQWCADMGMDRPSKQASFPPIHLVSGDSIDFSLDIRFNCGKAAMMFKLAWGGVGSMGMNVQATI